MSILLSHTCLCAGGREKSLRGHDPTAQSHFDGVYACALLRRLVSRPEPSAPSQGPKAQTPRRSGPGPRPSPPATASGVTGGAGAQYEVLDAPVPGAAAAGATGRPPVCPAPGRLSASAEPAREGIAPYAAAGALADAHATGASWIAAAPGVGEGQVEGLLPPPVPAVGAGQAAGLPPQAPLAEVVHAARSRSGLPALVAAAVQNCKACSPAPGLVAQQAEIAAQKVEWRYSVDLLPCCHPK